MTRRHAARAALLAAAACACDISEPQRFTPAADASVPECPQLFTERTEVWVDTTCKLSRCGPNAVEQQGCTLRLTAEGCDVGELEGEVDPTGFVRFTPVSSVGDCVSRDPVEGAAMALFC